MNVLIILFLFSSFPPACWAYKGESSRAGHDDGPYIIDDFGGNAINRTKWNVTSDKTGQDPFSQSGGRLNFSVTAGGGTLQSTQPFGPGFYTMQFFTYSSSNSEESGSHRGAFVGLGLGPKDNFVRIIRCQNARRGARRGETPYFGVLEANFINNAKGGLQVFYVETQVTAGKLGLYYVDRK